MQTYQPILDAIRRHGRDAYPFECCGFLLGDATGDGNYVVATLEVDNHFEGEKQRHYLIRPRDYVMAERAARQHGLEVVGFYHSHPDALAKPSTSDLQLATFPGFTYVIVAVEEGWPGALTAWSLAPDRSRFVREAVTLRPLQLRTREPQPAFIPDQGIPFAASESCFVTA